MKFSFATQILIVVLFVLVSSAQQSPNQINQTDDNYKPVTEVNSSSNLDVRIATREVVFGTIVDIPITLNSGSYRLGDFDFLIKYDQSVMTFLSATPGQSIIDCGWEYFNFRHGPSTNCGTSACKSGIVRVVSIAETNNGATHPTCYNFNETVELFSLSLLVTNDYTFECLSIPIEFIWYDCFDNSFSIDTFSTGDVNFNILAVADLVFSGNDPVQKDITFPSYGGIADSCFDSDYWFSLESLITFHNGGIKFPCNDIIDDIGDLNLNGIANEVADAVLFGEYFVKGLSVFTINTAGQIEATDVNRDGEFLKLEDLIYLLRIIEGNGPANPDSTIAGINVITDDKYERQVSITTDQFDVEVWLNFLGDVSPNENTTATVLDWYFDGQLSRFLISGKRVSRQEDITLLEYSGKGILIDVQASTIEGYEIIVSHRTIGNDFPRRFDLHQNYPNPFNGETAIRLDLPKTGMVRFEIVNVLGQVVYDFERQYSVGSHTIYWDGSSNTGQTVGSGVYYYRITAGDFVSSKKMILLK